MAWKFVMQKVRHVPPRILRRLRQQGLASTFRWFAYQIRWRLRERQLGINTAEHAYGLDVYGSGGGQYYDPIDHRCLDIILDYLNPDPDRDVFLDYGAGLGRAVIFAALRPFRRVIGVEVHQILVDFTNQHLQSAAARGKLKCDVEIVHADAADYELPADANRVLMYNAFFDDLLPAVLEQIRKSLAEHPRELVLVYAPLLRYENLLEDCPWLRLREELPTAFWDHVRVLVYEADLDKVTRANSDQLALATPAGPTCRNTPGP